MQHGATLLLSVLLCIACKQPRITSVSLGSDAVSSGPQPLDPVVGEVVIAGVRSASMSAPGLDVAVALGSRLESRTLKSVSILEVTITNRRSEDLALLVDPKSPYTYWLRPMSVPVGFFASAGARFEFTTTGSDNTSVVLHPGEKLVFEAPVAHLIGIIRTGTCIKRSFVVHLGLLAGVADFSRAYLNGTDFYVSIGIDGADVATTPLLHLMPEDYLCPEPT
jgi:hypothetical protein